MSKIKMDISKNWYNVLGVSVNTKNEDIKKAYYEKAKKYHPDGNSGNSEKFKEINEAYRILGNIESKKMYDRMSN